MDFEKGDGAILPREVIYRPKAGFGVPLRSWVRGPLRELLHEMLGRDALLRRGLFEPSAVERMFAATESGASDHSYTLLGLVCVELWCRQFIDGVVPEVSRSALAVA